MNLKIVTGELINLNGGSAGVAIHCTQGSLWLTTGDGCDYFIRQGQQWQLKAGMSALVEAFSDAELYLARAEALQMVISARPVIGSPAASAI